MKIITYATHSEGMFNELINSDVEITVLGWGTKWNGFMDKFNAVQKFLSTQRDDEIIVFLDGFDSKINKSLLHLENVFRLMNCKVLVSLDDKIGTSDFMPDCVHKYITRKVFSTCKGSHTANTGLYMGYAKELRQVLATIQDGEDDQREFNSVCSRFDFIKVDDQKIIFENCSGSQKSGAFFVQYPGTLSVNRSLRAVKEYSKYFVEEILFVCLLIFVYELNSS